MKKDSKDTRSRVSDEITIYHNGTPQYLSGTKTAILVQQDTSNLFSEPDSGPVPVQVSNLTDPPKVVPWGLRNDLPQQLIEKVYQLPQMTSNLWFNIVASYGDGVKPVKITYDDKGQKVIAPYTGNQEVNRFFEENDINGYLLEQLTDMHWFFNVLTEIIFNKEDGEKRKIVEIRSKEAAFSRWTEMDKTTGRISYHYYFAWWGLRPPDNGTYKCIATDVLDFHNPIRHLRQIMDDDAIKTWEKRINRFIVPVNFPTPGRNYYQKPYWYSLIESGWYDFAINIPEFKKAIMNNQMAIKFIVYHSDDYFPEIFRRERITGEKEQLERLKKEYADINKFLKGADKAGKSIITFEKKDPTGKPYPLIRIESIRNEFKGGEYLEDSEEVSNIIAYGMLVHPSLVGATPGKNKNISGTEARELFILKQALLKPFRDRILKPFYLIKAINKWPDDLYFVIPNIELTTLDTSKTGSVTKISTP